MKRYKLVRIINDKFYSANTTYRPLKYVIGKITSAKPPGLACYKLLKNAKVQENIKETMQRFNGGEPVAILEVRPIGSALPLVDIRYKVGGVYEGGINYLSVCVIRVVKTFRS